LIPWKSKPLKTNMEDVESIYAYEKKAKKIGKVIMRKVATSRKKQDS